MSIDTSRCWLTTEDVARRYSVPVSTVQDWRLRGVGPAGVKLGRHVRYSEAALIEWERAQAAKSQ